MPTFGEPGYPALNVDSWFAFFVPSATPAARVRDIHAEIAKVLASKDVIDKFAG